jgi:D-glycero-alpha-D-manno-heptose-7-phosphate kinase
VIVSQTPFRVSFFGGGTDYPVWAREQGGAVLSTSINKYCYITCRHLPPFFEHKHRIVYSIIETVKRNGDIKHPAVRAIFNELGVDRGLEMHYDGDLPARSGIGSSSSFTVGLLNALYALLGRRRSNQELAQQAIHIEQNILGETVGYQDQIAAAYGGFNRIEFHRDGDFTVSPVIAGPNRINDLNDRLMLFFTGFSRIANSVAESKVRNFSSKEKHLHKMFEMVGLAEDILQDSSRSLDDFGYMLNQAWELKRDLSDKVSNTAIDEIYKIGTRNGALGGKILGAGGGGFVLFYVPLDHQGAVRKALSHLIEVDFRFENKGSRVVLYNPDMAIYRGWYNEGLNNPLGGTLSTEPTVRT